MTGDRLIRPSSDESIIGRYKKNKEHANAIIIVSGIDTINKISGKLRTKIVNKAKIVQGGGKERGIWAIGLKLHINELTPSFNRIKVVLQDINEAINALQKC